MASMSQHDFEELCNSIKDSVSNLTRLIGEGIDSAGNAVNQAIGQAREKHKAAQEARSQNGSQGVQSPGGFRGAQANRSSDGAQTRKGPQAAPFSGVPQQGYGAPTASFAQPYRQPGPIRRFRSSSGLTASGIVFIVLGAIGAVVFGASMNFTLFGMLAFEPAVLVASEILLAVPTGLAVAALVVGIKRLKLANSLNAFQRIFGNREVCTIAELAQRTQRSEAKTLSLARKMIKQGLIPAGRLDDESSCLIVTEDAYRLYLQAKNVQHQRELEQQTKQAEEKARREQDRNMVAGMDAETAAFIRQGQNYLEQMRGLDAAIDDRELSAKIVTIEGLVERILTRVKEDPSLVGGQRRLTDYYLPTTVKLLSAYEELEEQPVQGENISASRREIEQTLDTLCTAYEKMLDYTFKDMSMDVSSDVAVLYAMLAREGLTESPFADKGQSSDQEKQTES